MFASKPRFWTCARFSHLLAPAPYDGGSGRLNSASFDSLLKNVASTFTRSLNKPMSAPASISVVTSGLSFCLPIENRRRPGVSPASVGYVEALRNWSAATVPGCTPALPYAVRRRTRFSQSIFGQNASSEITYDTDARGYTAVSYTHLRAHETGRNL